MNTGKKGKYLLPINRPLDSTATSTFKYMTIICIPYPILSSTVELCYKKNIQMDSVSEIMFTLLEKPSLKHVLT